jgi:hypothetical protein
MDPGLSEHRGLHLGVAGLRPEEKRDRRHENYGGGTGRGKPPPSSGPRPRESVSRDDRLRRAEQRSKVGKLRAQAILDRQRRVARDKLTDLVVNNAIV